MHLVRAKCTAWNLAPGSLGGGSYEVHLIVLSEKASALRNAPMRLKGVTAVAEAALRGFGRGQANAPHRTRSGSLVDRLRRDFRTPDMGGALFDHGCCLATVSATPGRSTCSGT